MKVYVVTGNNNKIYNPCGDRNNAIRTRVGNEL